MNGSVGLAGGSKPWIHTPVIHSTALSKVAGCQIYLKMDNLQPSGSFKSRGIGNYVLSKLREAEAQNGKRTSQTHFFSSSGGNAGLACVVAAVSLQTSATIVVPVTTSQYMIDKMKAAGAAEVIQIGKSWMEADTYLREELLPEVEAKGVNAVYVHPYDAPEIWQGHSTLVDELVQDMSTSSAPSARPFDAIICSVGGGGLLCGVMQGLDRHGLSEIPVIAVETVGADSLAQSVQQRELITLPAITSIATTLGARRVANQALQYGLRPSVQTCVVTDRDAVLAANEFADLHRVLLELSCSASLAVCYESRLQQLVPGLAKESKVVIEVCGGSNMTISMLQNWLKEYA